MLASDGTVRWTGEPVARLIAGENALEPRFRILADEQLTGPARDGVEARLALWLKTHIEKLLGPLVALGKSEEITGIARGVAFQLVEALGVLERQKVAEEVKGLDQPARAGLRAHGIRFGAYHIYMPLLLKPAPRALSLLLWGLKHGGLGQKGISELPALAASGRTSIPIDPEIGKPLYRAIGYRVCGSRALRVDILERLADLIRPALSWRPGMPGEKPAGTADGRGFTVTVAMTSLAGCAGEDFSANSARARLSHGAASRAAAGNKTRGRGGCGDGTGCDGRRNGGGTPARDNSEAAPIRFPKPESSDCADPA